MLWVILTLIAALFWAVVNILDKHVVSDELRDPILCTVIYGTIFFILAGAISIFCKTRIVFNYIAVFAAIAGAISNLAVLFYYRALEHEEVSRVIPLLLTCPLFVLLLATIFLGERFNLEKYAGIALLVSGAIIVSLKKKSFGRKGTRKKARFKISAVILVVLLSALLYALRDVLVRYVTSQSSFLPIFFWVASGGFLVSLILFAIHHPNVLRKTREVKGVEHLLLISIISTIALFVFMLAISLAKVALVSTLVNVKVFLVLALAVLLSKKKPEIIREHLDRSAISIKIAGAIILFVGSILVIA